MRSEEKDRGRARELRKLLAEQRNATLALKLLRSNSNYDPLLNMPPQAPLLWRMGAGILGMFFLIFGFGLFCLGLQDDSWALLTASVVPVLVSVLPLRNALKGRKNEPAPREGPTHE
jgi:hypothetical protein